jgi:hypothetical protein
VIDCPATVIVPDRGPAFPFPVTKYVALPLPVADPTSETHGSVLDDVHAHVEPVVIVNDPLSPPIPTESVDGVTAKLQPAAAA